MGRRRKVVLLAIACLVAVAAFAWLNRPRDETSKTTVEDAVRSFREEDDSRGHGGSSDEPALGVYRYATQGSESVKGPGFGTTHDYGGVSTIAVSAGRHCKERERWQVLVERWTESEACAGRHGRGSARVTQLHEFFGEEKRDSFLCHGPAGAVTSRLGAHYSSACRSTGSSISTTTHVIGARRISVGGRGFEAIGTVSQSLLKGATSGTSSREEWRRRSDGLLLSRWSQTEADSSEGGGSHYSERYTIRLLSTTPQR